MCQATFVHSPAQLSIGQMTSPAAASLLIGHEGPEVCAPNQLTHVCKPPIQNAANLAAMKALNSDLLAKLSSSQTAGSSGGDSSHLVQELREILASSRVSLGSPITLNQLLAQACL